MAVPNQVTFRLTRHRSSVPRARSLLHAMLGGGHADQDVLDTAELVLSELVTNALRVRVPHDRQVGVRIVHLPEDGLLRLEVSDAGPGRPTVHRPDEEETGGRGLLLVEALTHRWGVQERPGGIGKTVWAEMKAPCPAAVPPEREIVAVALQPGQEVMLRGRWRTVRSVRGAWSSSGGFVMLCCLSEGLVVRVNPAEPLAVRDGGGSSARESGEEPPG